MISAFQSVGRSAVVCGAPAAAGRESRSAAAGSATTAALRSSRDRHLGSRPKLIVGLRVMTDNNSFANLFPRGLLPHERAMKRAGVQEPSLPMFVGVGSPQTRAIVNARPGSARNILGVQPAVPPSAKALFPAARLEFLSAAAGARVVAVGSIRPGKAPNFSPTQSAWARELANRARLRDRSPRHSPRRWCEPQDQFEPD